MISSRTLTEKKRKQVDTKKTIRDMTSGSPMRLILGFAVPMLLGILFQQLYSMVDTVMVGRFLGADALAAVGSTGAINFMVNSGRSAIRCA